MYAGSTLTHVSGRFLGAHQKIDRLAERQLAHLLKDKRNFPSIENILHFEGCNGPDAIKRKSPAKDEPWHYFQPYDVNDVEILNIIESHYQKLVESLRNNDSVRSSFEAAWLAHAVVDGLTPAHHYPYGEKVVELRGGKSLDSRVSIKEKIMMPGTTLIEMIINNWKFWGPKGLFITHAAFEIGIATMIKPLMLGRSLCGGSDMFLVHSSNLHDWYRKTAINIVKNDYYNRFYRKGWTRDLAQEVKNNLVPTLVQSVTLVWYGAIQEAMAI